MKKILSILLAAALFIGLVVGWISMTLSKPDDDVDAGYAIGSFHLEFGEPVVLEQGHVDDRTWGHYQFPSLTYLTDGRIKASWSYGTDTIEYKSDVNPNGKNYTFSNDWGATWSNGEDGVMVADKNLMKNGRYFVGFTGKGAHAVDWLDEYEPAFTYGSGYKMFFREDLPENEDTIITASEYDPATGETTTFDVTVNWPYAPILQYPDGMVYPFTQMFALSNRCVITIDGDLYVCMYFHAFDSFASSRADAVKEYCDKYSTLVFKSTDNGRTWDLLSQLMTDGRIPGAAEGLCEPEMTVMPDGSIIMLMRTGSANPSYIARSTDLCKTWSQPVQFDNIGVLPQLATLDCGVTIATYGRPAMRVRATADPAGLSWEKSIKFDLHAPAGTDPFQTSCFYTDLLPLDAYTALWIYTDFYYPNEDGDGVKTVLVRTITVVPD